MRIGSLDARRRRRPGLPQGRGRGVFVAFAILAVLYVIGLFSEEDRDTGVRTEVAGVVETTSTPVTTTTVAPPTSVTASVSATKLPAPLSRSAAVVDGNSVLVLGGRNAKAASVGQVLRYEPTSGALTPLAALGEAVQSAAVVNVANRPLLIGGAADKPTANVVALVDGKASVVGHLPEPRVDAQAVVLGGTLFVLGGSDGAKEPLTVLASTDGGATFRPVGALLRGNRRGMLVAAGDHLYLIGGEENGATVDRILRIDPTDGAVAQIGTLPAPVSGATVFVLEGSVFIAGGRNANAITDQILRLDLATGTATPAGTLPTPLAAASSAVSGSTAYLFGGESPAALADMVEIRAAR
jgi:hypothetical protein